MKYPYIKCIGKTFIILLWIFALLLLIEVNTRIYEYITRKTNPLIVNLNNQPPWSPSEPISDDNNLLIIKYPQPDMSLWLSNRAEFFLHLDNHEKQLFSSFYQLAILYQENGAQTIYLPEPKITNYFDTELMNLLSKEISSITGNTEKEPYSKYYPSFIKGDKTIKDFFIYFSKKDENQNVLICWYKAEIPDLLRNTTNEKVLWEIPYFEYKQHAQLPSYEFHTNNFGFRDEDIVIPKPPDVYRIVCIGGSTTIEGPAEQNTYPNLLEKYLNEQYKGPHRIEVINAGVPGITANKLWFRLPDFVLMQPDLVLYSEGANDITHILLPYWLKNLTGLKKGLLHATFVRKFFPLYFLPDDEQIRKDMDRDVIHYIEKIKNYLTLKGISFGVMTIPAPDYSEMTQQERVYLQYVTKKWWGGDFVDYRMYNYVLNIYNAQLKKQFNDRNILYIPMNEMYTKEHTPYFNDLCHQKLKGIQRKAEYATPYILEYLKAPLSRNK